jgi:hypothetical protein
MTWAIELAHHDRTAAGDVVELSGRRDRARAATHGRTQLSPGEELLLECARRRPRAHLVALRIAGMVPVSGRAVAGSVLSRS